MSGPAAVVVAGAATIWLAVAGADGLVADDYYRRGLAINQELGRDRAALERGISAEVRRTQGELSVRLTLSRQPPAVSGQSGGRQSSAVGRQPSVASGQSQAVSGRPSAASRQDVGELPAVDGQVAEPDALFALLTHATRGGLDLRLRLARVAPGSYRADLPELPPGRWRLVLQDPRGEWRIVREAL